MKLFHLICVVAAAFASNVHALDGGPASGGGLSANPANRVPRTESADGGPMSGTAASTNPNAPRPAVDAGPATSAGDAGPPMSGGDMSTNPNLRTTAPPSVTQAPTLTTSAPVPVVTTKTPASTSTSKPPATITEKPPATITEKPALTPTPSSKSDGSEDSDVVSTPTPRETGVLDFSIIKDDDSGVVAEVTPDRREDDVDVVPSDEIAGEAEFDATAKEAEDAESTPSSTSATQVATTPSPVSKKTNTQATSSARRSALPSVVLATMAVIVASAVL